MLVHKNSFQYSDSLHDDLVEFFFAKRVNIPAHLKATYFILPAILLGNVAKQRW
jgi:hypothetical protein